MKLTGILAIAIMTATAWAQNPDVIDNTRSTMKSVQRKQTSDSNAALAAADAPTQAPAAATAGGPATAPLKRHDPMVPKTKSVKTGHPHATIVAAPATAQVTTIKIAAGTEAKNADAAKPGDAVQTAKPDEKKEDKKWAMTGRRDPFFSPVVQQPTGSGCSTGKKCLEIGQINLRGVVRSDGGFIAVVTNTLNKAYFLRENDPVFNGYVVKITGDSVVFQETVQDKLGKSSTREVVKRLFTPAV